MPDPSATSSQSRRAAPPVIVVGTSATIPAALQQVSAMGPAAPRVLGVILADPAGGSAVSFAAPVLGAIEDIPDVCRHLGARIALVSLPAALVGVRDRVRDALHRAGAEERFLTPISDVLADTGVGTRGTAPQIDVARLVGREPRRLDESRVRAALGSRRILITGAGGSIGSELAHRCAALGAGELILMDRSENALFDIDRRIAAAFPGSPRRAVLHDVVDAEATLRRLVSLRPDVVFHAAAHKHVPMMEDHPAAAVNNNLFGTRSVADAARAVSAERFVMISTDKAVHPTSVMGATKRLAEIYVRALNDAPAAGGTVRTRFSLVRFGNVLASACSVLPIWTAQIAEGGPVTVTHPEMTRYFMTIPEAAALVIQAATIDEADADVFVLDMGEPVRIVELAARFVRAHGLEPHFANAPGDSESPQAGPLPLNSIRVLFTGIRPGEKLSEELAHSAEELVATPVPGIMAWRGPRPAFEHVERMIADMSRVRHSEAPSVVQEALWRQLERIDQRDCAALATADAA